MLREHVRPSVRMHYAIMAGGDVPNVVPEYAKVWMWVRDSKRSGVEEVFARVKDIAKGAGMIAGVESKVTVQTGDYELLVNRTGAAALQKNLETLGPITYTPEEIAFAKKIQEVQGGEQTGLDGKIHPLKETQEHPTGIRAVEASIYSAGYPVDAAAVLLIEIDGLAAGIDDDVAALRTLCLAAGARDVRVARDEVERTRLWQGRKKAFGAMGRVSSHLVVQDAVIPRTRLPEVLREIASIAEREGLTVCNVFHAGDGNLHPNIPYNANDPDESARVHRAMQAIMRTCVDAGGSVTGEHGIGLDKLDYMSLIFSDDTLDAMCRLRSVFDPDRRANPGKVVPVHACREWSQLPALR